MQAGEEVVIVGVIETDLPLMMVSAELTELSNQYQNITE